MWWMFYCQVRNTTALTCKCRVLNHGTNLAQRFNKMIWANLGGFETEWWGRWKQMAQEDAEVVCFNSWCTSDSVGGDLADAFLSSLLPQILHDLGQVFLPGRTPVFPAMRWIFLPGMPESTLRPCIVLGAVWIVKSRWVLRSDAVLWHQTVPLMKLWHALIANLGANLIC